MKKKGIKRTMEYSLGFQIDQKQLGPQSRFKYSTQRILISFHYIRKAHRRAINMSSHPSKKKFLLSFSF